MFSNSHQVNVHGGHFFAVEGDYNIHLQKRSGFDILLEGIAKGALHNSGERFDPPKCHPNTRAAILKRIMDWIQYRDRFSQNFMWIYGPAGSGKSAIAQSIAELCYELGLLLATFFFSRSVVGRNDDKCLVATIAYQITLSYPETKSLMKKAMEHDPALLSRDLEAQLNALIFQPLSKTLRSPGSSTGQRPQLIIIDGLDECQDPMAQTTIIRTFTQLVTRHNLPFAILFASRPEYHIREAFGDTAFKTSLCRIALDDTYNASKDIQEFLSSQFKEIRDTHQMKLYIPAGWPGRKTIQTLVEKSSGQFIYASTVIKYVKSYGHRPSDRLETILGLRSIENGIPFAELDNLYTHILSSVENYSLASSILGLLLCHSDSFYADDTRNPQFLDIFFSLRKGSVYLALSNLHSIMKVPEHDDYYSEIEMTHASFGDFLFDRSRSGRYFLDPGLVHADLAIHCMQNILGRDATSALTPERQAYAYSVQSMMAHCSRARFTLELQEILAHFDFVALLTTMARDTWIHPYRFLISLYGYFTWLSGQIDPGAHVILKHHFNGYLLFEMSKYYYREELIRCYVTFRCRLTLATCGWLVNQSCNPQIYSLLEKLSASSPFSDLLLQFFDDNDRARSYTMTPDPHAQSMLLVLKKLISESRRRYQNYIDTKMSRDALHILPIALSCSPPSTGLFHCVSSILSSGWPRSSEWGCPSEDPFLEPEVEAALSSALSDYLKKCRNDPSFSVPTSFSN